MKTLANMSATQGSNSTVRNQFEGRRFTLDDGKSDQKVMNRIPPISEVSFASRQSKMRSHTMDADSMTFNQQMSSRQRSSRGGSTVGPAGRGGAGGDTEHFAVQVISPDTLVEE